MAADPVDAMAERIVHGAQERFCALMMERLAAMLAKGAANPDVYAVPLSAFRREAMAVWAAWEPRVTAEARSAFVQAMAESAEQDEAALAAVGADAPSRAWGAWARGQAEQAADGVAAALRRANVSACDAAARAAADAWYAAFGQASSDVLAGAGPDDAVARAVCSLMERGLSVVDYRLGPPTPVDAAVRRVAVTEAAQARMRQEVALMDDVGWGLVYTSAHAGARPSHRAWQGRAYALHGPARVGGVAYPDLAAATGWGTPGGLCGCNCRHRIYPYAPGATELPEMGVGPDESDALYRDTQRQRELERRVRACKRAVAAGQARGLDMAEERVKLGAAQRRLRDHCAATGLPRDYRRERAYAVAEQPRALGLGTRGPSLSAFAEGEAFKASARSLGIPRARALEALKARLDDEGGDFRAMGPDRQLRYLDETVRKLRAGATEAEARAHVLSSHQPKAILAQKQNAHIRGTREWDERVARQGGKATQSEVTVTLAELQEIVDRLHGTGEIRVSGDQPQVKETLAVPGAIIGVWRDENGRESETGSLTLHYSKRGVHAVPSRPSWRKE